MKLLLVDSDRHLVEILMHYIVTIPGVGYSLVGRANEEDERKNECKTG
jgi:hypothetical protein